MEAALLLDLSIRCFLEAKDSDSQQASLGALALPAHARGLFVPGPGGGGRPWTTPLGRGTFTKQKWYFIVLGDKK